MDCSLLEHEKLRSHPLSRSWCGRRSQAWRARRARSAR
jgi:hypothetical protein